MEIGRAAAILQHGGNGFAIDSDFTDPAEVAVMIHDGVHGFAIRAGLGDVEIDPPVADAAGERNGHHGPAFPRQLLRAGVARLGRVRPGAGRIVGEVTVAIGIDINMLLFVGGEIQNDSNGGRRLGRPHGE